MIAKPVRGRGLVLLAAVLGCACWVLAEVGHERMPRPQPMAELAYYPSGRHLQRIAFGHSQTAADLAWLRAVQYYGEHRKTDNRFDQMFHVFNMLTSLSPGFESSYVFGAFALAQEGADFDEAERLILKGIEENPTSGNLAFQAGFLYYVKPGGRDLLRAAEYFEQAARYPDGPPQAARFAAFARQHAGDLSVAWALWTRVYETSPNPYMREMAEKQMRAIARALEDGETEGVIRELTVPKVVLPR